MEDVLNSSTNFGSERKSLSDDLELQDMSMSDTLITIPDSPLDSQSAIDNMIFNNAVPSNRNIKGNHKKTIVIISSGNGGSYELFHRNDFWIEFYLRQGCHVCLWNYRGYGLSTGSPTFKTAKSDSELIYDYLTCSMRYTKVILHGISIGGIPTCHLAK